MHTLLSRPKKHPLATIIAGMAALFLGGFGFYWVKYSRMIHEKLRSDSFQSARLIYAAPRAVRVGDLVSPAAAAAQLASTSFSEMPNNPLGWYVLTPRALEMSPISVS